MLMLEVQFRGRKVPVAVDIQYDYRSVYRTRTRAGKPIPEDRQTVYEPCDTHLTLYALDKQNNWYEVGKGSAFLHPNDQFDRRMGRKIAWEYALIDVAERENGVGARLSKEITEAMWAAFLAKVKMPKAQKEGK